LKSDQNFLRLQDELSGTENRIAVERRRYNEEVMRFNVLVRRFPANMLAGMFNFHARETFEAPVEAKTAPKVKF
jgi:LemA protein